MRTTTTKENIYVPQSQKSLANASILQRLVCACITSNGPVGSPLLSVDYGRPLSDLGWNTRSSHCRYSLVSWATVFAKTFSGNFERKFCLASNYVIRQKTFMSSVNVKIRWVKRNLLQEKKIPIDIVISSFEKGVSPLDEFYLKLPLIKFKPQRGSPLPPYLLLAQSEAILFLT